MRNPIFSAFAVAAISCGGSPVSTPISKIPTVASTVAVAEPNPNVREASASRPKSVVLVGRAQNLAKTIDAMDAIAKLPRRLRQLIDAELTKEKASYVQLSGSFDLAVTLDNDSAVDDPQFRWAFSVPLQSADQAADHFKREGADVRMTSRGSYRVRLKAEDLTCDVGVGADAPGRAICSEDARGLQALSGWMMRGLAGETRQADIWLRFEAAALKDRYLPYLRNEGAEALQEITPQIKSFLGNVDAELLAAPEALLKEGLAFGEDVDAFELAFSIDPQKQQLVGSGELMFRSKTSWTTDVLTEQNDKPEPPPAVFFRLPKDSVSATYGKTSDPRKFAAIRRIARKATELGVSHLPLNQKERQSLIQWVDAIPSSSGMWVSATGLSSSKAVAPGPLSAKQAVDAARAQVNALLPWSISGGTGDIQQFSNWLSESSSMMQAMVQATKRNVPKGKQQELWMIPALKFQKNPAGFPKGSAVLDATLKFTSKQIWELLPQNKAQFRKDGTFGAPEHPKGPEARGEVKLRLAVVPDESGRIWFGLGTDADQLRKALLSVLEGAPTKDQLSARTDLELLKNHRGYGGFVNYGSSLRLLADSLSDDERKEFEAALAALPNKAQAPIFFLGGGKPGAAPSMKIDLLAAKPWVEDLGALIRYVYTQAGGPK